MRCPPLREGLSVLSIRQKINPRRLLVVKKEAQFRRSHFQTTVTRQGHAVIRGNHVKIPALEFWNSIQSDDRKIK